VRRVFPGHVIAVGQQPGFDAFDQIGAAGPHVQVLARGKQGVPQRFRQIGPVHIDFKTALLGISRPRHDQVMALERQHGIAEKPNVAHIVTKHPGHQVIGFRPLNRQRRDIRLIHIDLKVQPVGQALDPEQKIAVGDRNPIPVLRQFQCHRVVEHTAGFIDHGRVEALTESHRPETARRQHLDQPPGVRSPDLDLAFAGDIPHLNMAFQMVIIALDRVEYRRQQHVIVDRIGLGAAGLDPVRKRRAAGAPGDGKGWSGHGAFLWLAEPSMVDLKPVANNDGRRVSRLRWCMSYGKARAGTGRWGKVPA